MLSGDAEVKPEPKWKTKTASQSATGTSIVYLHMTIPNYFF